MKKVWTLIFFLCISWFVNGQTLSPDVNFLLLTKGKSFKDTLFINPSDASKLHKFYKDYEVKSIPPFIKQGELFINAACGPMVALCIDVSQHKSFKLEMKLKNYEGKDQLEIPIADSILIPYTRRFFDKNAAGYWEYRIKTIKENKSIEKVIKILTENRDLSGDNSIIGTAVQELKNSLDGSDITAIKTKMHAISDKYNEIKSDTLKSLLNTVLIRDILVINLSEYLIRFYMEKPNSDMSCCPENYFNDARREATQKVCQLLGIKKGIKLILFDNNEGRAEYYNWAARESLDGRSAKILTDEVPKIDPRKYLVVEGAKKKTGEFDIYWDDFLQTKRVIDSRSEVFIRFKQDELKKELFFRGNISLMAQINDSDPIEIPPYSVIGENFSTVGTVSLSPYDFALSFLTEMMNIYDVTSSVPFSDLKKGLNEDYTKVLTSGLNDDQRYSKLYTSIKKYLKKRDSTNAHNEATLKGDFLLNEKDRNFILLKYGNLVDVLGLSNWLSNSLSEISKHLTSNDVVTLLSNNVSSKNENEALKAFINNRIETYINTDFYFNERDSIAISYQLNEFFSAANKPKMLETIFKQMGSESPMRLKEFDNLISFLNDAIQNRKIAISNIIQNQYLSKIDYALNHLKESKDYFDRFMNTDDATLFALLTKISRDSLYLAHASNSISDNYNRLLQVQKEMISAKSAIDLTNGNVSEALKYKLSDIAIQFQIQMKRFIAIMDDLRKFENEEYKEARNFYIKTQNKYPSEAMHEFIDEWANYLAAQSASQLYKKLIVGKIDLTKRNISDDSKLTIYVLWYEDPGKPAQKLPIASFILRKLGWNEQIVDSFFLVNQLNAPDSVSRFKGAAGVSLMWSYTVGEERDFIKRLQPSFGINVSYLDFDPKQSFELGVGALVGLWKNKVFIGLGRNLHVTTAANYFSLGFSFGKIAETWKGNKTANQPQ